MRRLLFALLLSLAAPVATAATADQASTPSCFYSNAWQGWNVSADGDTLYLRVLMHDIYRLDLAPGSRVRKYGDNFLINQVRGSNQICSAIDLDLSLSDYHGFQQPLFPRNLRKLSATEIAAIPRKELP